MSGLSFIIPVRHQDNAKNWAQLKRNLSQTMASIAAQTDPAWNGFVVANHGADLPPMPPGFSVVHVDYPKNILHDIDAADRESVYRAFRQDKGRRVLAGMVAARPQGHVMIVDDDDFVSRKLAAHVSRNASDNGWYIRNGYVWSDGGFLIYRHNDFSHFCGSSHIIRADLYDIPARVADASPDYIQRMLGSHVQIAGDLERRGTPLQPLPFRGAVYRIGHEGAHSKSSGIIDTFVAPAMKYGVRAIARNLLALGYVNAAFRRDFFAA